MNTLLSLLIGIPIVLFSILIVNNFIDQFLVLFSLFVLGMICFVVGAGILQAVS